MNITKIFLDSAPSRYRLEFGVNTNVKLKSISNEVKRDKNGSKINKLCYMTFAQIDPKENTILAESVFSYFGITTEKPEFAIRNFTHQVNQLVQIVLAVVPEDKVQKVLTKINDVVLKNKEVFSEVAKLEVADIKLTKKIIEVQKEISETFEKAMKPYFALKGDMVDLVVVTDPKGTYKELPKEEKGFICKHGTKKLTIDRKYQRWYKNKDVKKKDTSDNIGSAVVIEENMIVGDGQDLDSIL